MLGSALDQSIPDALEKKETAMRANTVKVLWAQNKTVICGWVSADSPLLAEIMGNAGLDAIVVDMQHGMTDLQSLPAMLTAVATTPAIPMVRLNSGSSHEIMKSLDAGAYGLICPLVNTADDANSLVLAASYPPRGGRSYGPFRAEHYGGDEYLQAANQTIITLAMIETRAGYDNLEAILAVDGLDGIFVGPSDLALTFGYAPGPEQSYDELEEAIAAVLQQTQFSGKRAGIFCSSGAGAKLRKAQGFDLVVPGNDAMTLRNALKDDLALLDN